MDPKLLMKMLQVTLTGEPDGRTHLSNTASLNTTDDVSKRNTSNIKADEEQGIPVPQHLFFPLYNMPCRVLIKIHPR